MLKRLLQAATITLLLNLIAYMNATEATQRSSASPSLEPPRIAIVSLR
jgi:hypothetical protein